MSKRKGLLALTTGSGRVVYPLFQFADGGVLLPELDTVLRAVPESLVSRWTIASWLVSPQVELSGRTLAQLLRAGATEPVLAAAHNWAAALAA